MILIQKSSKSELFWGTFGHFKVYTVTDYFGTKIVRDGDTNYGDNPLAKRSRHRRPKNEKKSICYFLAN